MNTRNLIWSAAILAALIAIIVVSNILSNRRPQAEAGQFFAGLTADNLAAFQITDKDGSVKVLRKGDVWVVSPVAKAKAADTSKAAAADTAKPKADTGEAVPAAVAAAPASPGVSKEYAVDSASVASAVEKLTKMEKDVLISENADKQALFEVDNEKGMTVQVWDVKGKDLGTVLVGKSGPDWSSHYVRIVGSNKVYSVSGSIRYAFFSDIKRWRDKSVQKFDKASAKKIVIQKQAVTVDIQKSSDTAAAAAWKFAGSGDKVKTDEVNKILDDLSNLNCTDWAADSEIIDSVMGFVKPEAVVTAILANGDRKVVTVGSKKPNTSQYYVRAEGKSEVYLVQDWIINKFDVKAETLKEAPPADTSKAAAPATTATAKPATASKPAPTAAVKPAATPKTAATPSPAPTPAATPAPAVKPATAPTPAKPAVKK